jgi:DNA polymerase-3 subunit gamma/tau
MMSASAFNALLKTLEEPPTYVIFILATTEYHKLPTTIVSRCQRFDFKRISSENIMKRLFTIAEAEGIDLDNDGARVIARISRGGMRDAISLLELCAGDKDEVTAEAVKDTAGVFGRETAALAVKAIADRDCARILEIVNEIYSSSKDIAVFISDMLSFYRDMTVQRSLSVSSVYETGLFDLTENEFEEVKRLASKFTYEKLIYHYRLLADSLAEISRSESKRISAEMLLLKMASDKTDLSLEALATRISDLEKALMRMPRGAAVAETTEEIATDALEEASEKKERVLKAEVTEIQSVPEEKKGASETSEQIKITRGLWNLVLDKFTEIEPSVVSYLKEARVFTHNSRLIVEVPINFMKVMLSAVGAEKILSNIIVAEDSRFSGADIRLAAEVPTEASPIDELL